MVCVITVGVCGTDDFTKDDFEPRGSQGNHTTTTHAWQHDNNTRTTHTTTPRTVDAGKKGAGGGGGGRGGGDVDVDGTLQEGLVLDLEPRVHDGPGLAEPVHARVGHRVVLEVLKRPALPAAVMGTFA